MKAMWLRGIRGRPSDGPDFLRQSSLNPCRCQWFPLSSLMGGELLPDGDVLKSQSVAGPERRPGGGKQGG